MPPVAPPIQRFARRLQDTEVPPDVNNFYAAQRTNTQRHNLQCYLQQMREQAPTTLLVGEAPGHNGCARTGVPFSSEKLLREGVLGGQLFGAHHGYRVTPNTAVHEQTAAAMWQAISCIIEVSDPTPVKSTMTLMGKVPLLWNAYPFHPHAKDKPRTNRKPRASELTVGMEILEEVITLFDIQRVIAVGNAAEAVLQKMGMDYEKVRHPSYGGKSAFTAGLQKLLREV